MSKDIISELLKNYENTAYVHYEDVGETFPNSVWFDELPDREVTGVLKVNRYVGGRLLQTYSEKENHVGVIASTRLGKTTSYVIPTVVSFARAKNKKSMVISDPKGEIYRRTSAVLKKEGYEVLLLNFRDYMHSECWNPLTSIFRKYRSIFSVYDEVEFVGTVYGPRNKFHGIIYDDQRELDDAVSRWIRLLMEEVGNDIDSIATMVCPTEDKREPYWEDSARELLKAILWAMLEDSDEDFAKKQKRKQITEDTFSFGTVVTLMNELNGSFPDYFSDRPASSRAKQIAASTLPSAAATTRQCIVSIFSSKMAVFRETAMRLVTSANSFEMSVLTGDKPVAVFICYRDELKVHYKVISLFIQDAYRLLIEHANAQPDGKRKIPFYFVLDEFGNFPAMSGFETTISACAGRNIFFILIMQSYAQLNSVYGDAVAAIVVENLNMHIFMGSNDSVTLEKFSKECGKITRLSPLSALNGNSYDINNYQIDTIPLIPVSRLARFSEGECIITEANCGYVLLSKLERYYECAEFSETPILDDKAYVGNIDPFDKKYIYEDPEEKK